ncbi:hypothetical protein V6N13_041035 [Hibiscus sabdariffa]|uniref:Uncharacterized protein n=1 Tax=Hibiscus sabdariffa TaxID=183260 RepID=A0ABR2RA71_9ROSI
MKASVILTLYDYWSGIGLSNITRITCFSSSVSRAVSEIFEVVSKLLLRKHLSSQVGRHGVVCSACEEHCSKPCRHEVETDRTQLDYSEVGTGACYSCHTMCLLHEDHATWST